MALCNGCVRVWGFVLELASETQHDRLAFQKEMMNASMTPRGFARGWGENFR